MLFVRLSSIECCVAWREHQYFITECFFYFQFYRELYSNSISKFKYVGTGAMYLHNAFKLELLND